MKKLFAYGTGAALTLSSLTNVKNAKAETPMQEVMKRVEDKNKISFTDLQKRDEALRYAYGHFLPFDRTNITTDGRLIELNENTIDNIIGKSYPNASEESAKLDSLLSSHQDFYIAAKDGSFVILTENANLVGTTDDTVKTSFSDLGVNESAGNYLGRIARKTDRVATEANYLFNNLTSLKVSLAGRKSSVLADLPNRFGIELGTNSSLSDVKTLVEESGIYSALENALTNVPNLGRSSKVDLRIFRNGSKNGNVLNYEIVIKDDSKEFNQFQGTLTEDQFWKNHKMTMPTETVSDLESYLGITPVAVASLKDSVIIASADTSTVKEPAVREQGFVGKKEEKKEVGSEKPTIVDYIIGVGYNPVRGIAGMQLHLHEFVYGAYGGISKTGDKHTSVSQSNVSVLGNKHEVTRDWNEDGMGWFVGGDFGYRINKAFSVIVGADAGIDRLEISGKASPRVYDKDGKVIGRNPDQVISDSNLRKRLGLNAGVQYKGISGKYSYDVNAKKHGIQVTFPIVRYEGRKK